MIIAFWSPVSGQCGTSTNMSLLAHVYALKYGRLSLMIQSQYHGRKSITDYNVIAEESQSNYGDVGLDALIMGIKSARCNKEMIDNCVTGVVSKKLDILQASHRRSRGVYEYGKNSEIISRIPLLAAEYYDTVFIDTAAGDDKLSLDIISKADLTVINLRQNKRLIEMALESGIQGKVFYLFSHYSSESKYCLQNLCRMYREITSDNTGIVPYSSSINDAASDGRITSFVMRNINADRDYCDYYAINSVRQVAEKLVRLSQENVQEEE